ncbi:FHA domain-containing protein [Archangium violaceum]|uniref:FHA domain-containing protein n=1 Tax=Archangium violaceum TaxID=83451 RepID=UPI00193C594B|nr:FHA domain-containing protein [Archangium violaceum]QRK05856.1 FHA domain-containing protein [Archangium violaceum]
MLSIQELRALGASLSIGAFRRQLGPFVLIQRSPGRPSSLVLEPTRVAAASDIEKGMLSLLFEFDDLLITTLPPLARVEELGVGRLPDCDLVVDDSSVSKRHATLRWSEPQGRCTVKDLGSTNGTFLNGASLGTREATLKDGDILSFGNVQFWYLMTDTLHARLHGPPSGKPGYRGG